MPEAVDGEEEEERAAAVAHRPLRDAATGRRGRLRHAGGRWGRGAWQARQDVTVGYAPNSRSPLS